MTALTLTRTEAAARCGLTPSGFDGWVRRGIVPPPIAGTKRWSRVQLERALAGLPWVPSDHATSGEERGMADFAAWSEENDERNKHRPLFNLNKRQEQALRTLVRLGISNGKDIDGAGEATFKHLLKAGLAARTPGGWTATAEGITELERIDTWLHWYDRPE